MSTLTEDLEQIADSIPKTFYGTSIFITGATGLIGSLIVKGLITCNKKNNANITVLAFVRNKSKAKEVFTDFLDSNLQFVLGDVTSPIKCDSKIDYIIHGASQTASKEMVTYPVETTKTSVLGTFNIFDFAKEKNVKACLFLSSMEAFGICNNDTSRLSEQDLGSIDLTNVRSCYSESKRMCELLSACYSSEYKIKFLNARLSQVFGAGLPKTENRVFAQFVRSALADQDIILHTDGTSWGNYCYTTDVISALFTILEKGQAGETYTVVNEESSMMIKEMANLIIRLSGSSSKLVFDIPESNVFGYAPKTVMKLSSSKLQSLGWSAKISLEEMFNRLITSMQESSSL